jgi:hypothetical protein
VSRSRQNSPEKAADISPTFPADSPANSTQTTDREATSPTAPRCAGHEPPYGTRRSGSTDDAGDGGGRPDRVEHSIRTLRDRVGELRPAYLPPDPASRTMYLPGGRSQRDLWFPEVRIPVGFG